MWGFDSSVPSQPDFRSEGIPSDGLVAYSRRRFVLRAPGL